MGRVLRVGLTGHEAELGRLPAADFARLILGVERVLARAAGHMIGREVKARGRRGRVIEEASHFRLLGIEAGSVVGVLELPDTVADEITDLGFDVEHLPETALDSVLDMLAGDRLVPEDVATALVTLADDLGLGTRLLAVSFETERSGGRVYRAVLDGSVRTRLTELTTSSAIREDGVIGVLVEADFETRTARLRGPEGQRVSVSFEEELEDDVYEALRRQAELEGEIAYDRRTHQAKSVRLRRVRRPEQLAIGLGLRLGDEWAQHRTIEELARDQRIVPVTDPGELRETTASEEEVDRLFAALGLDA